MKISTEQLRAIQEQEARRTRQSKAPGDFAGILAEQLQPQTGKAEGPGLSLPLQDAAMPPGILEDAAPAAPALFEEAAGELEDMFATLDRYAGQLAAGENADLRGAFGLLQDMNARISSFKERHPDAAVEQPELSALLNEIETLAVTETFKFNRGDYL